MSGIRKGLVLRGHVPLLPHCQRMNSDPSTADCPFFVDASGDLVAEAFRCLFDVGVIRDSTRSTRAFETFAIGWVSPHSGKPWRPISGRDQNCEAQLYTPPVIRHSGYFGSAVFTRAVAAAVVALCFVHYPAVDASIVPDFMKPANSCSGAGATVSVLV